MVDESGWLGARIEIKLASSRNVNEERGGDKKRRIVPRTA
jgi:hypothetical protein